MKRRKCALLPRPAALLPRSFDEGEVNRLGDGVDIRGGENAALLPRPPALLPLPLGLPRPLFAGGWVVSIDAK